MLYIDRAVNKKKLEHSVRTEDFNLLLKPSTIYSIQYTLPYLIDFLGGGRRREAEKFQFKKKQQRQTCLEKYKSNKK